MRDICYKCMRPMETCLCGFLRPFDPGVKYVFLMHPKEAKRQRTGTGKVSKAGLIDSEIITGINFENNERLNTLINDPQYYPVLLYPGDDAVTAKSEKLKLETGNRKILAIIIDSTWFCSKKMLKYSPNITKLPKLSFYGSYRSIFTFKEEPSPECVSTIETCYYLNQELKGEGLLDGKGSWKTDEDFSEGNESLIAAFKELVRFQLQKENDRIAGLLPNSHASDWKYTRKKEIPDEIKN